MPAKRAEIAEAGSYWRTSPEAGNRPGFLNRSVDAQTALAWAPGPLSRDQQQLVEPPSRETQRGGNASTLSLGLPQIHEWRLTDRATGETLIRWRRTTHPAASALEPDLLGVRRGVPRPQGPAHLLTSLPGQALPASAPGGIPREASTKGRSQAQGSVVCLTFFDFRTTAETLLRAGEHSSR